MAIKKPDNKTTAAEQYADDAFSRLNALPKPKVTISAKLLPQDKNALRQFFDRKGLSLAAGVTMIIKEYMEEHQIS